MRERERKKGIHTSFWHRVNVPCKSSMRRASDPARFQSVRVESLLSHIQSLQVGECSHLSDGRWLSDLTLTTSVVFFFFFLVGFGLTTRRDSESCSCISWAYRREGENERERGGERLILQKREGEGGSERERVREKCICSEAFPPPSSCYEANTVLIMPSS